MPLILYQISFSQYHSLVTAVPIKFIPNLIWIILEISMIQCDLSDPAMLAF